MKIEIELKDVLGEGGEISEGVRDAIVERVVDEIKPGLRDKIGVIIHKNIEDQVAKTMSQIVPDLIDREFTEVKSWGEKGETWTVRKRIIAAFQNHCVINAQRNSYNSDKNAFTEIFYKTIEKQFDVVRADIEKKINTQFSEECIAVAIERIRAKLKV